MGNVSWSELRDGADEPDAPAVVIDVEGTGWVRPHIPGRPDVWYRIGGGRGESARPWDDLTGPLFLAQGSRDVKATVELAYEVADRMGWTTPTPDRPEPAAVTA